jgi:ABC-type branched-subunit amino acid transport system substrate-binding protein
MVGADGLVADFSSQLTRIKNLNADLIVCGVLDAQAAMLVKRMKLLDMTAKFVGGNGVALGVGRFQQNLYGRIDINRIVATLR